MYIERLPNGDGLNFRLAPLDFNLNKWREFLVEIKDKCTGWSYDDEDKIWWIPESAVLIFHQIKNEYFKSKDQLEMF